jgi:hypothetical protein
MVRPFEDMLPAEQFDHMVEIHGLPYAPYAQLLAVEEHKADHEQLDYPHKHEENWARKRLEGDGVQLERVDEWACQHMAR